MNFKEWEKLEEDDHTVTIAHPKGHTMRIALKALPKIQREAISRLRFAKGGRIDLGPSDDEKRQIREDRKEDEGNPAGTNERFHPKGGQTPIGQMQRKENLKNFRKSKGPNIKGLSDGGEVRTKKGFWDSEHGKQALAAQNKEIENIKSGKREEVPPFRGTKVDRPTHYKSRSHYDEGGDVEADQPAQEQAPPAPTQITINQAPATPVPQMQAPSQSEPIAPKTVEVPAAQTVQPSGNGLQQEAQKTLNAVDQGKAAIQGQAAIDTAKAEAQVPIEQERLKTEQMAAAQDARAMDHVAKATEAFDKYVSENPIDPKHYQENMKSGQKVATGIGLFLGGLGSSFGGHNFAFDMLQKQIDRDIDAQKSRTENQKTVYGYYHNLFQDNNVATHLARASADAIMARKIGLAAAQMGAPQAKVNAQLGVQKLMLDSQEQRRMAAGMLAEKYGSNQTLSGGKKAPGSVATSKDEENHGDRILSAGADQRLKTLQFDSTAEKFLPQILEQKSKADLADKTLDTLNGIFPVISGETKGEAGYARNKLEPFLSAIPLAGGALGAAAHAFTDTPETRDFAIDRTALSGAVRGALQGNVSDDLLESTLSANLPEKGDSKERLQKKFNTLKEFIKSHTKTDMLRTFGLSKK